MKMASKKKKTKQIFIDAEDKTLDVVLGHKYEESCYICPQYRENDSCESFPERVRESVKAGGKCSVQQELTRGYTILEKTVYGGRITKFVPSCIFRAKPTVDSDGTRHPIPNETDT